MNKGLTDDEKLNLNRPNFGPVTDDDFKMPIIRKTDIVFDWDSINITGYKNINAKNVSSNVVALTFNYDRDLMRLWNNPLKFIPLFKQCAAVVSPDFSVSPGMNKYEFEHNVFMSRWLGNLWQSYGCTVIPSIPWATPSTYDLCLSGIEVGSVIAISTLGAQNNKKVFLEGYNNARKRIMPPLTLVYGDMIEGMYGKFVNYSYRDAFNIKCEQLRIPGYSRVFEIKEVA